MSLILGIIRIYFLGAALVLPGSFTLGDTSAIHASQLHRLALDNTVLVVAFLLPTRNCAAL